MEKYQFKIDGPVFKEGVPIHLAVSALDNFQSIIDKAYITTVGSKRISAKDREKFFLKATEFQHGSLLTVFEIAMSGVQLLLPLATSFGPQNVWDYTRDSFNLLKLVCGATQNGNKPTYEIRDNTDVEVHVGNVTNIYKGPVINIAEQSLSSYQDLAHLLNEGKVTEISAGRHKSEIHDIFLGKDDKHAFDLPTILEKEPVDLKCEIFGFNKFKNGGKLSVTRHGQEIIPGEYNFTIFGDQDNQEYIFSMIEPQVKLTCLVEMGSNPFGEDKVHKLHITGVSS